MKKYIISILISFILGIILCYLFTYNKSSNEKYLNKIDTVITERQKYIKDTIKVRDSIIKTKYIHDTISTDSIFALNNDSSKIKLFLEHYPTTDTNYLMRITSIQAKDAIICKESLVKDSLLLLNQIKSTNDCDDRLDTIKNITDTIKQENKKIDNALYTNGFKHGVVITAIISGLAIIGILVH